MLCLLGLLILPQIYLVTSSQVVLVYGYISEVGTYWNTQWLFTYTKVSDEFCWNVLLNNLTYDFGYYTSETCYLSAYQFVPKVYRGSKEDGRIVGFRIDGGSECPTGSNPPTFNDEPAESAYHNIAWNNDSDTWSITPKDPCYNFIFTMRGSTRVCYAYPVLSEASTFSTAAAYYTANQQTLTSPINIPEAMYYYKVWLEISRSGATKAKVITDAVRKDECNTAAKINTAACQYPTGFEFLDPGNPMHLYYPWVASPQISTSRRCVGIYINLETDSKNGKFDFFPCDTTCDNDYCTLLATTIST